MSRFFVNIYRNKATQINLFKLKSLYTKPQGGMLYSVLICSIDDCTNQNKY